MAFTRHFYPQFNFVYTECTGKIDDQSLLIHLMSFSRELKDFKFIRHLIDMRNLRDHKQITSHGLVRMGKMHPDMFAHVDMSTAVLINPSEDKKPVEIFSQLFTNPHLRVEPFTEGLNEPLLWLGFDKGDIPKIKRFLAKHQKPEIAA